MRELARELRDAGVRAAFGVPGSGASLALLGALEDLGLPVVGTAHEAAAVLMACAFGRQTGGVACAVSIKGPGLVDMIPGIQAARYEGWPVMTVSEAYAPEQTTRMHKRLDHRGALLPFVKAYAGLGAPPADLLALARAETPGPVHLDLAPGPNATLHGTPRAAADEADRLLSRLRESRRPLVIAGSLALRRPWGAELAALAVPVFTTVAAKGLLDERGALAAGVFTADGGALAPERQLLSQCDAVVGIGLRTTEVLSVAPFPAPLLLLDALREPPVAGWPAAASAFGADDGAFRQALALLGEKAWGDDVVARAARPLRERLTREAWLPGAVFAALETLLPPEAVLVVDTGLFASVAEHGYRARRASGFLGSANGRFMGVALPLALGAALQDPGRPVVCCVGDGGLPPYLGEWRLAVESRLNVMLMLMSDGGYGSVAAAAPAGAARRLLEMPARSWAPVLEAMGSPAHRVSDTRGLQREVRGWLEGGGPAFLELPFERSAYRSMLQGIR